jgi:arabinogalactan endo-1,4-beta-galactosidase
LDNRIEADVRVRSYCMGHDGIMVEEVSRVNVVAQELYKDVLLSDKSEINDRRTRKRRKRVNSDNKNDNVMFTVEGQFTFLRTF